MSRRASEETRERTEVRDRVSSEVQRRDLKILEFKNGTFKLFATVLITIKNIKTRAAG